MIETNCPGCKRLLRVDDEHAGRQARCPMCQTIYTVPATPDASAESSEEDAPKPIWQLKTPEGQTFGPVTKQELDSWVTEGRVSTECDVRAGDESWQSASSVYPVLQPVTPVVPQQSNPFSAGTNTQTRYRYAAPHRGPLILVLGIMAWVVACPFFGVFAWIMGSNDLREMRAGRMDPSGMGLTQAGQVIGMINTILAIACLVIFMFLILTGIALG